MSHITIFYLVITILIMFIKINVKNILKRKCIKNEIILITNLECKLDFMYIKIKNKNMLFKNMIKSGIYFIFE